MKNRLGRIDEIDVMRGIGILLVVIGHVFPVGTKTHAFIYGFHMPLFFIISGMTLSVDSEGRQFSKSDMRLVKDYFLYSALYVTFDIIVRLLLLKTYLISDIVTDLKNTFSLFGISVLWFVPAMVGARVLARTILSKTNLCFQVGICFGLICIGLYVPYHDNLIWITKILLVLQRISVASGYVMIGFILRRYVLPKMRNLKILMIAGIPNVLLTDAAAGIDFRTLSWGGRDTCDSPLVERNFNDRWISNFAFSYSKAQEVV